MAFALLLYWLYNNWFVLLVTTVVVFVASARCPRVIARTETNNPFEEDNAQARRYESDGHGFKSYCRLRFFSCNVSFEVYLYFVVWSSRRGIYTSLSRTNIYLSRVFMWQKYLKFEY